MHLLLVLHIEQYWQSNDKHIVISCWPGLYLLLKMWLISHDISLACDFISRVELDLWHFPCHDVWARSYTWSQTQEKKSTRFLKPKVKFQCKSQVKSKCQSKGESKGQSDRKFQGNPNANPRKIQREAQKKVSTAITTTTTLNKWTMMRNMVHINVLVLQNVPWDSY